VISREVRERLKLNPGDTLRYRVTSDGILLNKANEPGAIRSLRFPNGDPRPTKRPMADCRKPGLASWPELDPAIHLFSNRDDRKIVDSPARGHAWSSRLLPGNPRPLRVRIWCCLQTVFRRSDISNL
jgi:hypothetical protein